MSNTDPAGIEPPFTPAEMGDCLVLYLSEARVTAGLDRGKPIHVGPVTENGSGHCRVQLGQGAQRHTIDFGPVGRSAEPPMDTLALELPDHSYSRAEVVWMRNALLLGLDRIGWATVDLATEPSVAA